MTPFPVAGTVLFVFSHARDGGTETVRLVRGFVAGLFGFTAFCATVATALPAASVPLAFGSGLAAALLTQAAALAWLTRGSPAPASDPRTGSG